MGGELGSNSRHAQVTHLPTVTLCEMCNNLEWQNSIFGEDSVLRSYERVWCMTGVGCHCPLFSEYYIRHESRVIYIRSPLLLRKRINSDQTA